MECKVWGGHSSVATIFDMYGHLFPTSSDAFRERLNQRIEM